MEKFSHVVVGSGIVGSCAAWQLARKCKRVLLLDQFRLPHTRGSSHGQTRLIRSCYAEEHFAAIMPDAFAMWKKIEEEADTILIAKTGVLCLSSSEEVFGELRKQMDKHCAGQYDVISAEDMRARYPSLKYSGYKALLDNTGGVILANKALRAVQDLFKKEGGQLWDGKQVQQVELGDDVIKVVMQGEQEVTTPSLVVCAGAWTPKLFKRKNEDLSRRLKQYLQGTAVPVYYWKIKEEIDPNSVPSFIEYAKRSVYGIGPVEYPGMMKVTMHGGLSCDPDEREKAGIDLQNEEDLKRYVEEHLQGLEPQPAIIEKCMYTMTPDEDFIVDYLYEHKNVVIGCGFSGTGFKTAPVVGKLLSEMALKEQLSHCVPQFKLNRFERNSNK